MSARRVTPRRSSSICGMVKTGMAAAWSPRVRMRVPVTAIFSSWIGVSSGFVSLAGASTAAGFSLVSGAAVGPGLGDEVWADSEAVIHKEAARR
jgi:hypothetical protein